jgi:hypothetical protein
MSGIEMYLAARAGQCPESLSQCLGVSVDAVLERIEAARLCLRFQLQMLPVAYRGGLQVVADD